MRIRRKTALWIGGAALLLSLGLAGWRMTRPEYLKKQILALAKGVLAEGWDLEIDRVDYALLDGVARLEGLRLVRTEGREVVAKVGKVEAEISFSALFGRGRLASELRLDDPEITVERGADGDVPLARAFLGAGGGGSGAHPAVVVNNGVIRFVDRGLLAEGEAIVLKIRSLRWAESQKGEPSMIEGDLSEEGGNEGGAIGHVAVSGEAPPGRQGLRIVVDRFQVGEPLQKRLSKEVREKLAPFSLLAGTFGDEKDAALEVLLVKAAEGAGIDVDVTARPRGLTVNLKDRPYELAGIRGEVTGNSGSRRITLRDFEMLHGPTTFQAAGHLVLSTEDPTFEIRFSAAGLELDRELHDAYPPHLQKVWDTYAFHGTADIGTKEDRGKVLRSFLRRRVPGGPLEVDITAQLVNAGLSFKGPLDEHGVRHGFDWPVNRVSGEVSVKAPVDGDGTSILLQGIHGRHGVTEVTAEGSVLEWADRSKVDITLGAKSVPLDDSVKNCSPIIAGIFEEYGAAGRLSDLQVHIVQEDLPGAPTLATVVGEFDGKGEMTWRKMPLAVEGISGTVAYRERLINGKREVITEIAGVRGTTKEGAAVFADGTIEGEGASQHLHLRVRADAILLDGELEDALRKAEFGNAVRLWDNLKPSGPADLVVDVSGPASKPAEAFTLTLRGAFLEGWDEVRFPVANLTGTAEFRGGDLDLRSIRGVHGGREVTLEGSVRSLDEKALFDLTLRTTEFPLDETARGILGPTLSEKLAGYFTTVQPARGLAGDVMIRLRGPGSALDPTVVVENLRGGAAPFDLRDLAFTGGTVRYDDGAISIDGLLGTLGGQELRIPAGGLRFDRGEGSFTVEVRRLRFPYDLVGLIPADTAASLVEAIPGRFIHFEGLRVSLSEQWRRIELSGGATLLPEMAGGTGGLGLEGTFRLDRFTFLRGETEGDPTGISGGIDITLGSFDAGVKVRDLSGRVEVGGSIGHLGRGIEGVLSGVGARVEGRELRDAGGTVRLQDGVFLVQGLRGTLAGGDLGVSVEVGGRKDYEGIVTLSNARARDLFAPADPVSEMRGQVSGAMRFRKPRDPDAPLTGEGRVDIRNGTILRVPVFQGLYDLLQIGDPPEFTEGRLVFDVVGDKLTFSEVEMDSSVVGIHMARGRSTAFMDGRLDLKLLPSLKTGGILWAPFDAASLIVAPIFERIKTIYVRGTVQKPDVSFGIFRGLFASDIGDDPVLETPPPASVIERRPAWDF